MRNKEFQKLLKKNKSNSNSGFTLTELLVGLFMSIFVIGALGFGLTTVLQATQRENSKTAARNENSRALDFISDELRRASEIETDETNARTGTGTGQFNAAGKIVVLALNIPEVNTSATMGDADASTTERIIYYLQAASNNWKGPLVLHRWGPPLDEDGNYTDGTWKEQALIDGINNTTVSSACPAGTTTTPATPQGFYACIIGSNTAQLYLTGQTKAAFGINDTQTNDSKVVARARDRAANTTDIFNSIDWSVKGLGGKYNCDGTISWDMKTEFYNDPTQKTEWTQNADTGNKQPQPIEIDPTKQLTITSTPEGAAGCDSSSTPVSHIINFGDPLTFNGDCEPDSNVPGSNCSSLQENNSLVKGNSDETVQFFKKGYDIPASYGGYDADRDGVITIPRDADGDGEITEAEGLGSKDQPSLGRFLFEQGLAIPKNGANPYDKDTEFIIPTSSESLQSFLDSSYGLNLTAAEKQKFKLMGDDQRIIAFEVGQKYSDKSNPDANGITTPSPDGKNPGFDLQDNIFVVTSDIFKKKFKPDCFSGSGCSSSTPSPSS